MSDTTIAITMLWIFVFIYSIAGSIDFGAGFWSMFYIKQEKTKATNIANRYLSPSWEVTNVFIVLIVVSLVSFFPGATFTLGTVLLLPVSLILLLLAIRSAFLVFSHFLKHYRTILAVVTGVTGILIPGLLILVLPVTQGGFIATIGGHDKLLFGKLLSSWTTYAFMAFAFASTLFLSSLLLADYSLTAGEREAYRVYRRDAVVLGPLTLVCALLTVDAIKVDAGWLYQNLLGHRFVFLSSVAAFLIGYSALFWRRGGVPRVAVIAVILQYLLAGTGYGIAHLPWIVYPTVTIESGFTNHANFRALFWSYIVCFAIMVPGFILFWRMFMNRRNLKQN